MRIARHTAFFCRAAAFRCDRTAAAALEFAIAAPLMVALVIPMVDLGAGFQQQMQVQAPNMRWRTAGTARRSRTR